jgi:hypothetical protein
MGPSKISDEFAKREHDIRIVREERAEMVRTGQQILALLGNYPYEPEPDRTEIQKKLLEFTSHLSNIGSFCGSVFTRIVFELESVFGMSMILLNANLDLNFAPSLVGFLNMAVGIQVDFTKGPPFRVIGIDVKALSAQFKAYLKR